MRGSFGVDEHGLDRLVGYDSLRIVLLCDLRNERRSQNKGELLLEPPTTICGFQVRRFLLPRYTIITAELGLQHPMEERRRQSQIVVGGVVNGISKEGGEVDSAQAWVVLMVPLALLQPNIYFKGGDRPPCKIRDIDSTYSQYHWHPCGNLSPYHWHLWARGHIHWYPLDI
jgi:hypothetical protein